MPLKLELGCGEFKKNFSSIGVDALDYPSVDLVGDIFEVLRRLPDSSVDSVYSYHFIEHINDISLLMTELSRVVKPNALVEFVAPHFSNPYFYSDPTHHNYFGLYTFSYLTKSLLFARQVPTYKNTLTFSLDKVDLRFKSAKPFHFRYGIKTIIGAIFNSCRYMQELYEENFCYLFPCYEIFYRLRRLDSV